jgi:hypothetical protein
MLRRILGLLLVGSTHAAPADASDEWSFAQLDSGSKLLLARYRHLAPSWVDRTTWTERIVIALPSQGEMPSATESARNYDVEDVLLTAVEGSKTGTLVLVIAGNHKVEWHFYSPDKEEFMRTLDRALQRRPGLPLDIAFTNDPEWSDYRDIRSAGEPPR